MGKPRIKIDIHKLQEDYLKDGETAYTLAKKYNCHPTTIYRKLKEIQNKLVVNKLKSHKIKKNQIKDIY